MIETTISLCETADKLWWNGAADVLVLAGAVKYLWRPETAERKKQGCFEKAAIVATLFFLEKRITGRRGLEPFVHHTGL